MNMTSWTHENSKAAHLQRRFQLFLGLSVCGIRLFRRHRGIQAITCWGRALDADHVIDCTSACDEASLPLAEEDDCLQH